MAKRIEAYLKEKEELRELEEQEKNKIFLEAFIGLLKPFAERLNNGQVVEIEEINNLAKENHLSEITPEIYRELALRYNSVYVVDFENGLIALADEMDFRRERFYARLRVLGVIFFVGFLLSFAKLVTLGTSFLSWQLNKELAFFTMTLGIIVMIIMIFDASTKYVIYGYEQVKK